MLPDGFLGFINEHRLFTKTDRLLLAVSGGLDSVVLTRLMHHHGFTFGVAHVNFSLRGAESDADAAFAENMALTAGVAFHHVCFDTAAEAARRGESTQVTARQLRYEWFSLLQQQHRYVAVATAHHLNDVLETMLLNLTRGTGLAGLRGMPIDSGTLSGCRVVRPLWFAPRAAIQTYANEQGLVWREDASNATDAYSRNRIRQQVVPVLEAINPGLMQTLPRSLTQLRAADAIVQAEVAASFRQCVQPTPTGLTIDVGTLAMLSEPLFRLGEWLRPYGFTPDVLAQCWQAVDPARTQADGQVFLAPAHRLIHDRGLLWLLPLRHSPTPLTVTHWPAAPLNSEPDGQFTADLMDRSAWDGHYPADANTAILDADALPFPWVVRAWQRGDRLNPLGMSGTRLVSDLVADSKLPPPQRELVRVLETNGQLSWVLGVRIAHHARLTENTTRLAVLRWREKYQKSN